MDELPVEAIHAPMHTAAEPYSVPHDSLEDGPDFSRRPRDDLQDLARRRLLLQRLSEFNPKSLRLR